MKTMKIANQIKQVHQNFQKRKNDNHGSDRDNYKVFSVETQTRGVRILSFLSSLPERKIWL